MTKETKTSGPRYPEITVWLLGEDGNAFAILEKVQEALQAAGKDSMEFMTEVTSGYYDHLLQTVMRWVTVK